MFRRFVTKALITVGLGIVAGLSACAADDDGDIGTAVPAATATLEMVEVDTEATAITTATVAMPPTFTPVVTGQSITVAPTETALPIQASPTPATGGDATQTETPLPAITPTATAEIVEATVLPTLAPLSATAVNGVPVESIVVLTDAVKEQVQAIFAQGQALGRDPNAFSKLGDSLIASPHFLTQFDIGPYQLAVYEDLQPAVDYYGGSYERYGVALRPGLHAWGVFDPLWANKDWCQPNEDMLACEFRLNNPSVLLVLLGTNDSGNPAGFDYNMREVIEFVIDNGVIPVIYTKADRFEGPDNTNNNILRQIAADYNVPLLDFDLVADTIPERGLKEDSVHLTFFTEGDYNMPEAYQSGHGVHNLVSLMMLEAVRQVVAGG